MTLSSEESDSESEDTIVVRPLPWRSHYVTLMFERIDKFQAAKQSPQSRRQTKPRKEGPFSTRAFPIPDIPRLGSDCRKRSVSLTNMFSIIMIHEWCELN